MRIEIEIEMGIATLPNHLHSTVGRDEGRASHIKLFYAPSTLDTSSYLLSIVDFGYIEWFIRIAS